MSRPLADFGGFGGAAYGRNDACVRTAAADVALEELRYFLRGRMRVGEQQSGRCDQEPGGAVGALHGVLFDERVLQSRQAAVLRQTLDGGDGLAGDAADLGLAGAAGHAGDQYCTGAALAFAAAVL